MHIKNTIPYLLGTLIAFSGLLFATTLVFAETEGSVNAEATASVEVKKPKLPPPIIRPGEIGKELRKDIRETATATRAKIEEKRIEIKALASTTRGEIKDKRAEIKTIASTTRESIKAKQEEMKKRMEEQRKKIIVAYIERTIKRFEAAVERLQKLAGRIDSRLTKLKADGVDTTVSANLLATAKIKITKASQDIALIKTTADGAFSASTTPKTTFDTLKTVIGTAKKSIIDAHRALILSVNAIKPGRNGNGEHSTTTPPTATTTNQ